MRDYGDRLEDGFRMIEDDEPEEDFDFLATLADEEAEEDEDPEEAG